MFLSNPRKYFLLTGFFALILQACGSSVANDNKPISLAVETKDEFPFSTKEPEVYQGEFVVTSDQTENKWFIARNGEKWRLDFFRGNERSDTQLRNGSVYTIDHVKKIYVETAKADSAGVQSDLFSDVTNDFFRGKEYREFEDLGREGSLRKFKVREATSGKDNIYLFIDEASGMMVREEFTARGPENGSLVKYAFEIRNLKLEADDSIFAIPEAYRKVTWEAYRSAREKLTGLNTKK